MKNFVKTFVISAAFLLTFTVQAMAADLVDMKQSGLVGEQVNGLLGIVITSPSADVRSSVSKINDERLDKYKDVAQKNGIALPKVQAMAGEKLINQTPSGQYIMTPGGDWVRK